MIDKTEKQEDEKQLKINEILYLIEQLIDKVNKYDSLVEKIKNKIEECEKEIEEDDRHDEWGYQRCIIQVLVKLLDTEK